MHHEIRLTTNELDDKRGFFLVNWSLLFVNGYLIAYPVTEHKESQRPGIPFDKSFDLNGSVSLA